MTFDIIRRHVLELIDQYSVAGETVSPAYNNQSDTIHKIPALISQGIMRIRTETRPLRSSVRLSGGVPEDGFVQYELPEDCWRLLSGGVYALMNGEMVPFAGARTIGGRSLLFPASGADAYLVEYQRYPEQLPADPADGYDLQEEPDAIQAAEYYAAAWIVRDDSPYAYQALYNEFESRRLLMAPTLTAEIHPIGGPAGCGSWAGEGW